MAYFAKLNDENFVIEIHTVSNAALDSKNEEKSGIDFLTQWSGGYTNWKQTSYNGRIRKRYAGVGYKYDSELDAFIPPKPFKSWTLNQITCDWEAPFPRPEGKYVWNEETQNWDEALSF